MPPSNDVTEIEDYSASSGLVVRQDPVFYNYILRFVATMKKFWLANNTRIAAIESRFNSGLTAILASGVTTTLATVTEGGYKVFIWVYGANDTVNYGCTADVVCDGTQATIRNAANGAFANISLSGLNVQATQLSGAPQRIAWGIMKVTGL